MTEQQIAKFKQRLLSERQGILDDRAAYACDAGEGNDSELNDPADSGTDLDDRDRSMAAEENFDNILAKIDRALAKIDEGTYGRSDVDGKAIPIERLEALPYANTTVDQEEL